MAKAVISSILQSQLGRYVDGLAPESLQVGLWSGELLLTNLKLKPNALAELNLPIQVIQGSIAKVHVLVPWNQLGSASVQITLEGIYGVAVPNNELPTPDEVLVGIRNRLERAELVRQHQRHTTSGPQNGAGPKEDETFFSRLTSRIMDNLQITIRDFHIRYEDVTSNPSTPFTFGVLLESFTIETTDEQGRKVFVDRSEAPPAKMHKVATLKNLTVYWDRLSPSTSLQKSKTFAASMRNVIYSDFRQLDRRWLLLPPCSLSVRFTKNESQVFTKESPKYRIQATVDALALHLSREQYDEMVFMYLAMRSRLAIEAHFWYNRHRPFLSITNYSIVWWDYAVRFHSKKKKLRFRWSVVRKMARDRKMYMALYKQHHLQHVPLSVEQLAYLQRLEDIFPLDLTMRLRDVADAQFAKTKTDAQAAAAQSSWFGYFFGEGDSSKDVQEVLSAEGKADLKRAFDETVALEEAPIPEDCCIVVVDLTLHKGEIGLYAYKNVPLLTSEFTGSCLFQVQPASRWLLQLQLRRLNVVNWRCANTAAAGRMFCTLQADEDKGTKKQNAPFEISVAATDVAAMRVRVSADPIRVVLDPVFLLQLVDFFSTNDTLNDVWAYATSSVQNYVFAEQEADMRAVVATKKQITYDVLVDMKAPLFVLPQDATSDATAMVVLDLGRFHVKDVVTSPARAADVHSWQIDMTEIEVLLQQPNASSVVPIVPGFNVGFAVESSKNFQDSRIPFVTAKASMPSVVVNGAQDTIVSLGKLHASLLKQCRAYFKASSVQSVVFVEDVASAVPQDSPSNDTVVATATDAADSCVLHLTWLIESVQVNIDDAFRFNMRGTWFEYEARSSTTTIQAKLQDLSMEDRCHAPQSPYFYLARTEDSSDLIQVTLATSSAPTRAADTTVDVQFNVLHLQWNPSSIMMLYTMIAAYGSSMDVTTDLSTSIMSQSTILAKPRKTAIPSVKVTAALKMFSVSFNKDEVDRRLLTVTVADASLVYVGHESGLFNIRGELGDVTGVDFSVKKAPTYLPFFGMDRSLTGHDEAAAPKLLLFEYDVKGGASMPRLSLVLNSIRIVYFHQQILELVDYLFQGILGSLVNQTLLSATQLILEPAATLVLDIRIEHPKILVPMDPMQTEHFLLQSSRLTLTHVPSTFAAYADASFEVVKARQDAHNRPVFACDLKQVVLEQAGLYSTNGSGGYDDLMAQPMTLGISIVDIQSTRLEHDGKALPRFSIDCGMPHMHLKISRKHYLMFFRMLGENIGGDSLVSTAATAQPTPDGSARPVVVYEYANADLEGATMALSFLMESFSCALDIGLTLETTNLTVCLNLLNNVNPSLDVSLANASISNVMRCDSNISIKYEWDDRAGTTSLDIALSHLHGKLIPHILADISRFFALEAKDDDDDDITTNAASATAAKDPTRLSSFTMNVLATNVQLSLPQDLAVDNGVEFVVAANFDGAFESFTNHVEHLQQKLTLRASDCEALLKNANRQGCSDTLVQLIEPTTLGVSYLGFEPCPGHHQDKIDVSVSPIEVFLSYEDSRVLADVWATMQRDMLASSPRPPASATLTRSSSKSLQLVPSSIVEVQRHVTCDVKRMQLTLINDCDGCDMGLVQLELPTFRVFLNATTTADATTATGGCDVSFASSYYNPDSRVWHPLCPEWKLTASVMTNIPHVVKDDQLNSMQWNISADTLKLTATHGLLEALASAGGTLIKTKQDDDDALKHAPCLIQNESGLPIEYWWSTDPTKKTRVDHKGTDAIHYVHVKGKGSGVTRTYTSNDKEHGTLCINLIGTDTKPVQGIVVEQLGTRPHTLVETCGSLSKLNVTCDTQLVGGHIVLTISSHLRVQSHLSNEIQLLVYDPTWKAPVELGSLRPLDSTYIPIAYSTGSELRVRLKGQDWAYSSPIPIDATSTSTISVTCMNESSKVAVFCVALSNGLIELYEPYVLENKLPVSVMFQVKDAQSLPQGDDVVVGCKSAIWWCRSTPMFAFNVPGCETTNWLPLLRKRDSDTFSLVLKRIDRQPLTILVSISENKAKSVTITLLAEMWIINKTGLDLVYGNDADDVYVPQARSVIGTTNITLYSTPSALRFKMGSSNWTTRFKADPKRMNWQDECLAVTTSQGRLYEFGVSADYATRHFGVLTTLVSITPRYMVVNRTPWTLVMLEDDGSLQTTDQVHHVINAGESYSLWWSEGKRKALRASVVGLSGTSSWSDSFSVNTPNTFDLIIPNDVYCPFLQVSVKTGGLSQATFVIDIVRLDSEPDFEQSKWDIISYDIKVAGLDITLSDSTKATNPAYELFGGGVKSEDVARFSISDIRFDSFKDRVSTNSHLHIASITLEDLLVGTKYPKVLTPSKTGYDFVQFTYVSKRHPKYAYIEELTLWVKDVHLQTSMKFVDRINSVVAEVSAHFATTPVDLLTYFTAFDSMEMSAITGRKCFFERCHIHPINVVISFVRDKDDRIDPSAGFWLSNLKFRIKDASIVLDEYKLSNAFATQESVVHAVGAFYVSSMKGQALNLIESIQVTSLVTGVVKDGVSSLVSTLIGKTDTSLASSASFRYESLSNNAIIAKHSEAVKRCTSSTDFSGVLNHLVYDWDGNHTGLEARACMALGILNNSRQSVVLQVFLKDGAETRLIPTGRNYLDGASTQHWTSDRALIVFAWGYTPTLLTTGDICLQLQSNAFNLYISKSSTRLQPNPGYSATFTVQEKQSWWSKFMIIVGDDLPSQEVATVASDTYEVMFTTDALGIVAKQIDYQTVVVRECCYFSNGQPGPALATGRISEDDVILSVNGIPIKSTQAFKDIIVNTSRPIVVRFKKASFDLFGETKTPSGKPPKPDHEYSLFG